MRVCFFMPVCVLGCFKCVVCLLISLAPCYSDINEEESDEPTLERMDTDAYLKTPAGPPIGSELKSVFVLLVCVCLFSCSPFIPINAILMCGSFFLSLSLSLHGQVLDHCGRD